MSKWTLWTWKQRPWLELESNCHLMGTTFDSMVSPQFKSFSVEKKNIAEKKNRNQRETSFPNVDILLTAIKHIDVNESKCNAEIPNAVKLLVLLVNVVSTATTNAENGKQDSNHLNLCSCAAAVATWHFCGHRQDMTFLVPPNVTANHFAIIKSRICSSYRCRNFIWFEMQ